METRPERIRGIRLRGPILALVLVLLAAMGISVVAGLNGIGRLDKTLNQLVANDAQRLLHITHVRRLFRTEVLLQHERRHHEPGPAQADLDRRCEQLREDRGTRIEKLKLLGVPGAAPELAVIEELHRRSVSIADPTPWEQPLAVLLERTEHRFAETLREANEGGTAARRLLLFASLAALLAALGLGGLALRRVHQAGAELARGEEQLRRVLASAPSLLVVLSPARKPTFLSSRVAGFLGWPLEVLSKEFLAWCKPEERPELERRFEECLATGIAVQGVYAQALRQDGSAWDAWLSLSVVRSEAGTEVLMQILDVTAQRKAEAENRSLEAQLRQAQKMESIGLLAGGVAHDFNNLLTAIKGYASLLEMDVAQDESTRESVAGIMCAADRAAALTRKLLSFSRKQVIDLRRLRLGDIVGAMAPLLRRLLGEDVRLEVRSPPESRLCLVDASQVEQIVMNLAVNARQAMPKGGVLIIETSDVVLGDDYARSHPEVKPGNYVQLVVSDTGTGMTSEVQQRAFEPFYSTKPAGQGTGLGLSVVYGAVRQQGGHVFLYSEPNVGTTFRIYWPVVEGDADAPSSPAARTLALANGELLMLVEDDALVRSFARRSLQMHGYQVIDAESAEVALKLSESLTGPPALLVADVILPGAHGPALAEALCRRYPGLPVLFCSGYSEELMNETGHVPKGAFLLQKPYDAPTLVARVREMLKKTG